MAHEHHGEAKLLLELVEQVDDLLLHRHVESRGGLVGDDELGVARQSHGDEDTLTLAARELVRVGVKRSLGVETDELKELLGGTRATALGELLHLGTDEHGGVERREGVLIDHGDLMATQGVHVLIAQVEQVLAVVENLARYLSLLVEQAHDRERRDGLAAARLAHKAHRLTRTDLKAHVIDDVDVTVTRELDAEVLDLKHRGHLVVSRETIFALGLNGLELVEPGLQRGSLGLVGQLGVGHETVGLAVGAEVGVARLDGGLGGSHSVGDALRKDVQGKHGDDDGKTREERRPPVSEHDALTGRGEHVAPRSGRLGDAGVQERQ